MHHHNREDATRETCEVLFRDAHNFVERMVLAAVIGATAAADPPQKCASLDRIVWMAEESSGVDQWDTCVSLAKLDRRGAVRLVEDCGEVWVSIGTVRLAEVLA